MCECAHAYTRPPPMHMHARNTVIPLLLFLGLLHFGWCSFSSLTDKRNTVVRWLVELPALLRAIPSCHHPFVPTLLLAITRSTTLHANAASCQHCFVPALLWCQHCLGANTALVPTLLRCQQHLDAKTALVPALFLQHYSDVNTHVRQHFFGADTSLVFST